jgi:hypothetical protein
MATVPLDLERKYMIPVVTEEIGAAGITINTVVSVMITTMISGKILSVSRKLNSFDVFELQASGSRTYTGVVTILVESAGPSAMLGIILCIILFISSTGNNSMSLFVLRTTSVLIWSAVMVSNSSS